MMSRTLCLLCLFIFPAMYARCSSDQEQPRTREIIQKLFNLGESRPLRCKYEAESMKIHYPELPRKDDSFLQTLWEMSFRFASDLFMKDLTHTGWNSRELRHLRDLLGQQTDFYKNCIKLPVLNNEAVEKWRTFWNSLDDYLSENNYSSCAWESARTLIERTICSLHRRTRKSQRFIRSC